MPFLSTKSLFFQCATPASSKPFILCFVSLFFILVQCHGSSSHMKEQTPYFFQHSQCHAAIMYCETKKSGKRGILCRSVFNEHSEDAEMDDVGQEKKKHHGILHFKAQEIGQGFGEAHSYSTL